MIYLASDHGGYNLKENLKEFLSKEGLSFEDLGPHQLDPEDDYPDFAFALAKKVAESSDNRGILVCRNGVGVIVVANKVKGIRATVSWNAKHAKSTRLNNDVNIISLPADYINEDEAKEIAKTWLETPFSRGERHIRRLAKIKDFEESKWLK